MTIIVRSSNPAALLASIRQKITGKHIETWSFDKDGDFTHTPDQWRHKAWFRPHVESGQLRFSLMSPRDVTMTKVIYGVYHGRFSEMLITHFDDALSAVEASAHQSQYVGA